jgi:hypothetical protein
MVRRVELDALRADIEACQTQVDRMEKTIRELRAAARGERSRRRVNSVGKK